MTTGFHFHVPNANGLLHELETAVAAGLDDETILMEVREALKIARGNVAALDDARNIATADDARAFLERLSVIVPGDD